MSSDESSPPPPNATSTNNQNASRNNNVQIPNIKLLLKDNFTHKKCYRCQQLGSFQCEHSTKYRDELKEMKEAKGKFYQQPTPRMSQRTLFTKKSKGQIDSSIDDTLTSSVNASVD